MADTLVRDGLELLIVVAVGGMLVSAVRRVRAGAVSPQYCAACGRPTPRAYPRCKHCGADPRGATGREDDGSPDSELADGRP